MLEEGACGRRSVGYGDGTSVFPFRLLPNILHDPWLLFSLVLSSDFEFFSLVLQSWPTMRVFEHTSLDSLTSRLL